MAITRRVFFKGLGRTFMTTAVYANLPNLTHAADGKVRVPIEGVRTWSIGDIKCTTLLDGFVRVDAAIFRSADETARTELLERAGQSPDRINLDVNAYILEMGDELILIDTGTRDIYGATLGKVPERLLALAIDPASVSKVVLTHMHNDHVGGLTRSDGTATFANAELIVPSVEWGFWTAQDNFERASDTFRFSFTGARQAAPLYNDRVNPFSGKETEVCPGLFAIDLPGHSIGHTGYRLVSGNEQMIIWGDSVVSPELQFAHPEWSCDFDADAEKSIASRLRIMDEVATDKLLVAGMHLPFPGVGHVVKRGLAYHFEQAQEL